MRTEDYLIPDARDAEQYYYELNQSQQKPKNK